MTCSLKRLASCSWVLLAPAFFAWSCAQGGLDETSDDTDGTLPEVDASWSPKPDKARDGGSDANSASSTDKDASTPSEEEEPPPEEEENPPPPPPVGKPAQGEVLISEVMYDASGTEPSTEWIEVHNTTSSSRSLTGLTIVDGGNRTHVIGSGISVAPGAYVVLARSKSAAVAAKVPSAAIVYEYGAGQSDGAGIQLANGASGAVLLKSGSSTIAQASYGGWFSQSGGSSIQLKTLSFAAGTQSSSWCLSKNAWATSADKGTPGAASDCP